MQKQVKMALSERLQNNVQSLLKELEEKGYLKGDSIVYDDSEEPVIASLFDKYYCSINEKI